ncbi:hypothetical protein HYS00_00315 [Candidatus Microgenomates bacterium]|nr:hypothetical protein [Candidatus Microgenomates bacterium]
MNWSRITNPRILSLITAFVLLMAVPRGMSTYYESGVEVALFMLITLCTVMYYRKSSAELALVAFIFAIYYNPLFLVIHDIYRAPLLDIMASLFFFGVAFVGSRLLPITRKS